MDKVWFFDRNMGMAMLIPSDTPTFPCSNEADLRRIAAEYRAEKARRKA